MCVVDGLGRWPGGEGGLNLVRVSPVRPEQQQTVKFRLYVGKLGLSFWEDSKKATMFLEEQNKKKQPCYVYKSGQSNSRKVKRGCRKQTLSDHICGFDSIHVKKVNIQMRCPLIMAFITNTKHPFKYISCEAFQMITTMLRVVRLQGLGGKLRIGSSSGGRLSCGGIGRITHRKTALAG